MGAENSVAKQQADKIAKLEKSNREKDYVIDALKTSGAQAIGNLKNQIIKGKNKNPRKEDEEKINTLKQNQAIIEKVHNEKMKRHVKVKNEPVFDIFLNSFHNDYAKQVVSASALEIIKLSLSDEF